MGQRSVRALRTVLSVLVALCVAVAPLASLAATSPAKGSASVGHVVGHDTMPDCHGAKAKQPAPVKPQKDRCPDCGDGVCVSDVCQLKCFNALGDLPRGLTTLHVAPTRLGVGDARDFRFVQIRPPLPPPRV